MSHDIQEVIRIAKKAGAAILEIYGRDFDITDKEDKSPLTEADSEGNRVILEGLLAAYPDTPYISEEMKETEYDTRKHWNEFWLIDPLDGTKEFIKRNGEFTVNIALIRAGKPVMGVVYIPVQDTTFYAEEGKGCFKQVGEAEPVRLAARPHYKELDSIKVVASRSHLSQEVVDFVEELKAEGKEVDFISAGSSLKFCLVAEGTADVYPRLGPTMEWDTAAAHAVVLEAGLQVNRWDDRKPLAYNKEDLLNPFFIVE